LIHAHSLKNKTNSGIVIMKYNSRSFCTCLTISLVIFLTSITLHADEDTGFDVPGTLKASDLLPPELIKHEFFTVRDEVTWFDGLNQFTVDTEYGSFEIWGEPMLRVRLKEFIAWNELQEISVVEAGVIGAGRSALRSVSALLMAFAHPITTIQGVPQGISRMFKQVGRDLENIAQVITDKKDDESPGSLDRHENDEVSVATRAAERLIGVNKAYRLWALEVGVNPYSSNPAIREELNRVAAADALMGTGTKVFVPNVIKGDLNLFAKVSRSIYKDDWHELVELNKKALRDMGVGDELADAFLIHDFFNLSLASLVVEILVDLDGVDDRPLVIDQALLLETEAEAIWFTESLMMAQWFHKNEAPIEKMLPDTLVPVALTSDGRVVVFSAADLALWTEETAIVTAEFTELYKKYSDKREARIADLASPKFVKGLAGLGWTVHSGNRHTVLSEIPWGLQDNGKNVKN
jgi:hypothetical protein